VVEIDAADHVVLEFLPPNSSRWRRRAALHSELAAVPCQHRRFFEGLLFLQERNR